MYREHVVDYINRFLQQNGFLLIPKGDYSARRFEYYIVKNDIYFGIEFLPEIFETGHFWGFLHINRISVIEDTVSDILFNNDIIAVRPNDIICSIYYEYDAQYVLPSKGILIDSEEKADEVCQLFNRFYHEYFLPFYQSWNNLQSLYDYIKDKEGREELVPILGQFWQFKKAAILRLCNDSRYQEYMDAFVARRKMILDKIPDTDTQRYYNAAAELKEVLDKTEPIYNVKHKNTISKKMK